jgi:hypothetical protein
MRRNRILFPQDPLPDWINDYVRRGRQSAIAAGTRARVNRVTGEARVGGQPSVPAIPRQNADADERDQFGMTRWESAGYPSREAMEQEDAEMIEWARRNHQPVPDFVTSQGHPEQHHMHYETLPPRGQDAYMEHDVTTHQIFNERFRHHLDELVNERGPVEDALDHFTLAPGVFDRNLHGAQGYPQPPASSDPEELDDDDGPAYGYHGR